MGQGPPAPGWGLKALQIPADPAMTQLSSQKEQCDTAFVDEECGRVPLDRRAASMCPRGPLCHLRHVVLATGGVKGHSHEPGLWVNFC